MALPSSGQISFSQIAQELNIAESNVNLRNISASIGLTTPDSISEFYGYSNIPVTSNLILYLDSGDSASYPGTGTTWTDLSGNNNTASLINGPTYTTTNGGLLNFDGSNDYAQTGALGLTSFTGFTVEVWLHYNASNSNVGQLFSYGLGFGAYNVGTIIHATGVDDDGFYALVSTGTGTYDYAGASAIVGLSNATPYQLVWTYNTNGDVIAYQNGSFYVNNNISGWSGFNVSSNFLVQLAHDIRYSTSRYYLGGIYIVRVYNKTLSQSEVTQNFNVDRGRFGL